MKDRTTADEIRHRFQQLNVWKRGDQRAPHKPLLVLYALGRLQRGDPRMIAYADVDRRLRELLEEFGPSRKRFHPEFPFWRLQSDGVWTVTYDGEMDRRTGSNDVPRSELLAHEAAGGFARDVQAELQRDPALLQLIARGILDEHFPDSLHDEIADAVGLTLGWSSQVRRRRDPRFRDHVLQAYEYRCAICGLDLRLRHVPLALEAGHIKWHQAGGPDIVPNGLAMCSIHHKAFDRGAIGLSEELTIQLSADLHGGDGFKNWFLQFQGRALQQPQGRSQLPDPKFLRWHQREVFHGPARPSA